MKADLSRIKISGESVDISVFHAMTAMLHRNRSSIRIRYSMMNSWFFDDGMYEVVGTYIDGHVKIEHISKALVLSD